MSRRCRVRDQAIRPPAIGWGMAQAEQRRPRAGPCHPQHRGTAPPMRGSIMATRVHYTRRALMPIDQIKRREFITLLGGAAAAWPLAARAQQPDKLPTIGFLGAGTLSAWSRRVASFVQRLRELGWIEGHTIAIEYRWADGSTGKLPNIPAEFPRLKVDVIVTAGTPSVIAAKQATSVIPIVFATAGDPVSNGLVATLARPGGNVTGLSVQDVDLTGKRLELLRELVPRLSRLAILTNIGNPVHILQREEVRTMARALGV